MQKEKLKFIICNVKLGNVMDRTASKERYYEL